MEPTGPEDDEPISATGPKADFPATHWTLIRRVRAGGWSKQAALEELCGLYWYPIYVFLRRQGYRREDAEDLTQGFFLKLLDDDNLALADAAKGRLRTFLLQNLKRHLADQERHRSAVKRGGGLKKISFETLQAEERYAREPVDTRDPERLFVHAWANELLASVRERLRVKFSDARRPGTFEAVLPFLLLDGDPPSYREVAIQLRATELSARLLVCRLRASFRQTLVEEIARTVESPDEIAAELNWFKSALGPP